MKKLIALVVTLSFVLAACGGVDTRTEKERFISAMVEATCLVFSEDMLVDDDLLDEALVEDEVKDIFMRHGFDVEDEEEMIALQMKYENLPEVEEAIRQALYDCAPQEFIDAMEAYEAQEEFMFEDDFEIEDEIIFVDEEGEEME